MTNCSFLIKRHVGRVDRRKLTRITSLETNFWSPNNLQIWSASSRRNPIRNNFVMYFFEELFLEAQNLESIAPMLKTCYNLQSTQM